ncbi:MAG: hypothetical protein MHPSP_003291, partial [Paramarteilia canceri]
FKKMFRQSNGVVANTIPLTSEFETNFSNFTGKRGPQLDSNTIISQTQYLLGSGAVGLAPQIIAGTVPLTSDLFEGKRLRKAVFRKTVDYSTFGINSFTVILQT